MSTYCKDHLDFYDHCLMCSIVKLEAENNELTADWHEQEAKIKKLEGRLLHIGSKLNGVLGLNDQELKWMEDCGATIGKEAEG